MAKGNKKNKQKQKQQQKPASAKQKIVTQATITEAKDVINETNEVLNTIPAEEVNVAEIESSYKTDGSVSTEDIEKCSAEIKKTLKVLASTKQKYDELKSKLDEEKKQWADTKSEEEKQLKEEKKKAAEEADEEKKRLVSKNEELNERELKLIEDEDAARNGDHSAVIQRLIAAFKERKEEVVAAAEAHLKEQAETAESYLEKLENVSIKEAELHTKERELKSREKKIQAIEDGLEGERESMREEIKSDTEKEYASKLSDADEKANLLEAKLNKAIAETEQFKTQLAVIQAAFGDKDPSEMASLCNELKETIEGLNQEISLRPQQEDLNNKQKQIDALISEIRNLREKLNEKEYYELRAMFDNNDLLLRDKQLLADQLESAKAREENLKATVEDLRHTISEINESRSSKDNAFKATSSYDKDDYQVPLMRPTKPTNLTSFISYLQSYMASPRHAEKERRYYTKDTINKFIAGLHMSPITILQGISGTGKTSLPRAVAMAMMADDVRYNDDKGDDELSKAPYRICPIQSGWRDKMDLMGFYNSFEKSYHETEFFNALYLANQPKYENVLFFIVLDEMNLSRPEHYFADFLSKLELSSEEQRKVKIDNVPQEICPNSIKGGTISIPKNVRFIGTANHDETTLEFAPKTYDRSNVIEMPRNCPTDKIPDTDERHNVTYTWLIEEFEKAERNHTKECQQFDDFIKDEDLLNLLADKGIGIGNRFEGQAKRFLSVFVEAGEDIKSDTAKAADHLMTTRLLRTLKDNYDLSYEALDDFKNKYKDIFSLHFEEDPFEAIDLIEKELKKKNK